jgi:predicted  nucleic acid-binding Zn-ribbon protein
VDIDWLEGLERLVQEAARRLADLRSENDSLKTRIAELETAADDALAHRVRELEDQLAEARVTLDRDAKERDEVRRRVEGLTKKLEGLVEG